MGSSSAEKRRKLFDLNNAGLVALRWANTDTFYCPLCLTEHHGDSLSGPHPVLTLAHMIPESLGGTHCTLACQRCNSEMGTSLESALKERFAAEDAMVGCGSLSAQLSGEFGRVRVEVTVPESGVPWLLSPIAKASNPAHVAELGKSLDEVGTDRSKGPRCQLKLEYRHRPGLVGTALYHSAYLWLFHYFGYHFAGSPLADQIRAQLREPNRDLLPRYFPVPPPDWVQTNVDHLRKHAVMCIREPYQGVNVFMRFTPRGGRSRVIGVALPDFDGVAWPTGAAGRVRGDIVRIKQDDEFLTPWVPRRSMDE